MKREFRQKTFDKVNRFFKKNIFRVFSIGGGRIVEESSFSVPLTEDYESKIRAQIR